jgi:hypothetical protein
LNAKTGKIHHEESEDPNWLQAEDKIAAFFRNQGFHVQQQVKVGSGAVIDVVALWRRAHEKHHLLIECKDWSKFSRSSERSLGKQLHRYLIGYTKTKLPKEPLKRKHVIILLGICTNSYNLPHRQVPFQWDPIKLGSIPGRRLHAVRYYITTPSNIKKVLNDSRLPTGRQCTLIS